MALPSLLDDALGTGRDTFALRLSLPWIRSLPIASLGDLSVDIDGRRQTVAARLGDRDVDPSALAEEEGWWFVQDRLELRGNAPLSAGAHDVVVAFSLAIPYLVAGDSGPLRLPFRTARRLEAVNHVAPRASRLVA